MQFFYDKPNSELQIYDFKCPSAQRCVAAGLTEDKKGRQKGVVILTSDAGKNWSVQEVAAHPISLFFLNETMGWMVTDRGLWFTNEGGRAWTRLESPKGIVQVYFLDAQQGFAIGYLKGLFQTSDGGKKWEKFAPASRPSGETDTAVYDCISFSGDHGVILGRQAPSDERLPVWANPARASLRPERATPAALLETFDSGKNWKSLSNPIFGTVTQVLMASQGFVYVLFEYFDYYKLPSSLIRMKFGGNTAETVFAERTRAVTSFAVLPDGSTFLASVEPPGNSNQVPIPGKLRMLRSNDSKSWIDEDADYRAVAQRAILAAPDAQHAWVATDTGMILWRAEGRSAGH